MTVTLFAKGSRPEGGDDCRGGPILRVGSHSIPGPFRGSSRTVAVGTGVVHCSYRAPSKLDADVSSHQSWAAKTRLKRILKSFPEPFQTEPSPPNACR